MSEKAVITEKKAACVEITRRFAAPRELVFRAHTDPELLPQWLGPARLTMRVEEFDVRDGGRYRYVSVGEDGTEFAFRGVFHGTPTPDVIHQTWEFEGSGGNVAFERLVLEDTEDGGTLLRATSCYLDAESLDAVLVNGMEAGMQEGYERLDQLLPTLAATGS